MGAGVAVGVGRMEAEDEAGAEVVGAAVRVRLGAGEAVMGMGRMMMACPMRIVMMVL